MPTPIEQALITLLPAVNSLPPELLDLSSSLLAQSRAVAARLKPEEEIGRIYACAHIACERLKTKLGFEKVVPRPPCPPRIYKKLFGYLESALKNVGTPSMRAEKHGGTGTPGSKGRGSAKGRMLGSGRGSERMSRTRGPLPLPVPTPAILKRKAVAIEEASLPHPAIPMIDALCVAFQLPTAKTHIAAGAAAVLHLRGWKATEDDNTDASSSVGRRRIQDHGSLASPSPSNKRQRLSSSVSAPVSPLPAAATKNNVTPLTLPALLVSLTLHTIFKIRNRTITGLEYSDAKNTAVSTALTLDADHAVHRKRLESDVEIFLREAKTEGWLEQDWFANIAAVAADDRQLESEEVISTRVGEDDAAMIKETVVSNDIPESDTAAEDLSLRTPRKSARVAKTPLHRKEKHAPRPTTKSTASKAAELSTEDDVALGAGLVVGLGTMFQDSIDWLSADRRADYSHWERDIREQISSFEKEDGLMA
ncbi:hypothetical protein MBLNU459_g1289t1 [Dothideomycetes sp. NU459]